MSRASELKRCEKVIARGLKSCFEVWNAFRTIRDQRLYRDTHSSLEAYCRERWNISRLRAYQFIDAAQTAEALSPTGLTPTNESQVRPLAGLQPEDQRIIWGQAIAESNGKPPTAAKVESVKKSLVPLIQQCREERNSAAAQVKP